MERWLSMQLARRLGVWANPEFPFPRRIIERAIAAVLPEEERTGGTPFEPETAMWSIAALLPAHLGRPEFAPIAAYLEADGRDIKRIQLAQRIADTFDHYAVYRPRMVLAWEAGAGADWQPVLWRALVARHGTGHLARRTQRFLDALAGGGKLPADFPRRISLFGISTLPPLYLRALVALSAQVEVHLFLLSPSAEYWAEIRSRREIWRELARREADSAEAGADLHLEEGNPLLASLGLVGRDFQQVLEANADYQEEPRDLYRDPGTGRMLAALQSDVLALRNRGPHRPECLPLPISTADRSISVHACHGAMREIEVLHDQLLALFDRDPSLEPHDVVVMAPSIDAYAPFVDAVFSPAERIPYRIADRSVRATHEVVDAFWSLLAVLRGRTTAAEVLDLLAVEAIRSRFGIRAQNLDVVRRWVTESGIRWGVDAEHRRSVGQPAFGENTWRFGLDRLLLGYAMPGEESRLFAGVLPYDDVEGTAAELLGRLVELCETLFRFRLSLRWPRRLEAWREALTDLLAATVRETNATAHQHQEIREALALLAERARAAGFDEPLELENVRAQLESELQRSAPAHGFLSGGVTFCEMVPMRTIPFRVVCLIGMNDGAFPRLRRPLGFDLIARNPRPGDRSQRDDDRYLFLEALLSARDRLLITYVGQSITDNAEIPPSVMVSELLDTVEASFVAPAPQRQQPEPFGAAGRPATAAGPPSSLRDAVVVRHPLQPFSPLYFEGGDRLFSHAGAYFRGAQALRQPRRQAPVFLRHPLSAGPDAVDAADVEDLVRFFGGPSRFFMQRRLGIYLGGDLEPVGEREPMQLDGLDRWAVGDALLRRAVGGAGLEEAYAAVRAGGRLPLGVLTRVAYDDVRPEVEALAGVTARIRSGVRLDPVEIDGVIDGLHLTGMLRDVWPSGLVSLRFSRLGRRSELSLWIRHLILRWASSRPRRSALIGRPAGGGRRGAAVVWFRPVDDAEAVLRALIRLYRLGQRVPLLLFPRTSRAYVEALLGGVTEEKAREKAFAEYRRAERDGVPGEGEDPYVEQIYGPPRALPSPVPPAGIVDPTSLFGKGGSRGILPNDSISKSPLAPLFQRGESRPPGKSTEEELSLSAVAQAVFVPLLEHREEDR
jgi:exodeoxyribonuclease V gamma subunit